MPSMRIFEDLIFMFNSLDFLTIDLTILFGILLFISSSITPLAYKKPCELNNKGQLQYSGLKFKKFHFVAAASNTSLVSIFNFSKINANSFTRDILTSL